MLIISKSVLLMCFLSIWIIGDCLSIPKLGDNGDDGVGIILRDRIENDKKFLELWKIPQIVCHYASRGSWPKFPIYLQRPIADMSRYVFSMTDEGVKEYCKTVYVVVVCHRPYFVPGKYPLPIPQSATTTTTSTTTVATTTCVTTTTCTS